MTLLPGVPHIFILINVGATLLVICLLYIQLTPNNLKYFTVRFKCASNSSFFLFFVVSDEVEDHSAYAFHGHTGKTSSSKLTYYIL